MAGTVGEWTEADLLRNVRELAHTYGWLTYHTWNSRHSEPGFPDLVMVKDRRLIFAELKSGQGMPTAEQLTWLKSLRRASVEVYMWRPSDIDEIAEVLR